MGCESRAPTGRHAGLSGRCDASPTAPIVGDAAQCLAGIAACASGELGREVAAGHGLSGTTHVCDVSRHPGQGEPSGFALSRCLGLVAVGGVEGEVAQDFAGGGVADGDVEAVDEGFDGFPVVGAADADGVEGAAVAPASCPPATSRSRSANTAATACSLTAAGQLCGRRDRGSNAASPSTRHRASSSYTHDRATP